MRKTIPAKITDLQKVSEKEVRAIIHPDVPIKYTYEDKDGKRLTEKKAEKLQEQGEIIKTVPKSTNSFWHGLPSLRLQFTTDNPDVISRLKEGKQVKLTIDL